MAVRARHRAAAALNRGLAILLAVLCGCAGAPPPAWRLDAHAALQSFERHYLRGNSALAEKEFARARAEIAGSARLDLLARAELVRCAVRTASLEFDACPAFEARRADAAPADAAYADWLAKGGTRPVAANPEDPLSHLVTAGVQLRTGVIAPETIERAVEAASAQGWRRPLLAWLGVQLRRAEHAGERGAAERIRRRIEAVLTPAGG